MNTLELRNAAFAYPSRPERRVLAEISVSIPLGGASLVLGANCAGKTALARLLAGLDSPLTGSVRWPDGVAAGEHRFRAGVVFEQPEFQFQGFSVAEELAGGLLYRGVERSAAEKMAAEGARRFGIDDLLERDLNTLRPGEKLSVLVVAFLILRPLLLVLDFSLTELDEPFRAMLLDSVAGGGQPGLVVLSRRTEDLALLPGATLFALEGGKLEPFPSGLPAPEAKATLTSLGIALPWHIALKSSGADASGWGWLNPPAE